MHLLLLFVSRISVCTYLLQRVGLQLSDKYVHYYYGYGVAQGFVVELGGGLMHIIIIGCVNKLTTLVALSYFSSVFCTLITANWCSISF